MTLTQRDDREATRLFAEALKKKKDKRGEVILAALDWEQSPEEDTQKRLQKALKAFLKAEYPGLRACTKKNHIVSLHNQALY